MLAARWRYGGRGGRRGWEVLDNESGSRESEEEEDGGWRWEGPKLGAVVVVRVIRVIIYLFILLGTTNKREPNKLN